MRRTKRGRAFWWAALVALLLVLSGAGAYFLYRRFAARPKPTRADWHAVAQTVAGDGSPGFQDDEQPVRARFADPFGVAVDAEGNVYVSDAGESNCIRKITAQGKVSTLAGAREGFADGAGAAASFNTPSALALDGAGNLYVADTSNNRIRKVDPTGAVTTLAGDGTAGFRDGAAGEAQFDSPLGVAVDTRGNVFVADTYNDRIRRITPDGQVTTLAGTGAPGYLDGAASSALFDTPCALAVEENGTLYVADTANHRIRRLTPDGQVTTLDIRLSGDGNPDGDEADGALRSPVGLALTHDGFLYVTDRVRVLQISPNGAARVLAGGRGVGFADGEGARARFNNLTGIAVDARGALYVADSANYLVRQLVASEDAGSASPSGGISPAASQEVLPRLSASALGVEEFPWPVEPQNAWHEVVATMGEVRGSFQGESRDHLHSGIDIQAAEGATVRSVFDEKIVSPLANWDFGGLNEGVRAGLLTYIHMRVGRNAKNEALVGSPFALLNDEQGKPARVRVRRGTRLRVGTPLGTINRMYHVHLNFGPPGAEANPLQLPFKGFADHVAPSIERDGIQLLDAGGRRLTNRRAGRLVVSGDVQIVVDAHDQVDKNLARRRLGLYRLGYQLLTPAGEPAPGFTEPRVQIEFDRLPPESDAVRIAYADTSGITVYGNDATRFLYSVTNLVRDGRAATGAWHTSELPQGDYVLRIFAADFAGNVAEANRDLPITIE